MKVRVRQRLAYISEVPGLSLFQGSLCFPVYTGASAYMATTVMTTAQAHIARPAIGYTRGRLP